MIHININLIQIISFISGAVYFNLMIRFLDKKTRYVKDETTLRLKYMLLFNIFTILCLPFIKQISEKRKVEYFEQELKYFDRIVERNKNYYSEEEKEKFYNMKRYIKLKKVKNEIKWKRLKETVN